jgi:hypothetical protein
MKRKRGPAPHTKKHRVKPGRHEEAIQENYSDGENDVFQEEDSFKGFSSDDDEKELEQLAENDKSVTIPENGAPGNNKKRGKISAPTQEELMELLFQSSSFQSNLFKLQVNELLSEVRVKYEKMEKVETILHRLKDVLMQLPESQEQLVPHDLASLMQDTFIRSRNEEYSPYSRTFSKSITSQRCVVQIQISETCFSQVGWNIRAKSCSKASKWLYNRCLRNDARRIPKFNCMLICRPSSKRKITLIIGTSTKEHVISPLSLLALSHRTFL